VSEQFKLDIRNQLKTNCVQNKDTFLLSFSSSMQPCEKKILLEFCIIRTL